MENPLLKALIIFILALIQNVSFTLVSRSRNRSSKSYHITAAIFSNSIWFLTFRELVRTDMSFVLFLPYVLGTVLGSVLGMTISMKIESWLGASADSHLKKQKNDEK